jgi:hypothetical protein
MALRAIPLSMVIDGIAVLIYVFLPIVVIRFIMALNKITYEEQAIMQPKVKCDCNCAV